MKALLTVWLLLAGLTLVRGEGPALTDRVNVDFPSEYRETIVRNVAQLYGLDVDLAPGFPTEKISLTLKSATWEEIIAVCLHGSGFTFVKTDASKVRIVPGDDERDVVGLLNAKLIAEIKENQALRAVVITLLKDGQITCDPSQREALAAFVLHVDHSPASCLERIVSSCPIQTKPTNLPQQATSGTAQEVRQP
jgi:hypothetical protein